MQGPDCPIHNKPMDWLSTTNEWQYYCPRCDVRYNKELQSLTRAPGRPWYTISQYQADFYPRKREFPDLTPGAWLAKKQGCTCSRLDNQNGYGSVYQTDFSEGVEFLVIPNCPLHDKREEPR